ncbi:hypothetical protein [Caulobacter endophyticus]|uniref:hypothetical protein n=1 Tax=Caulobacter endophyticus TaxID=2172652 RepID=UPI0024102A91|nr:hypothetical protein [Caulobacter endophyticus]MDG2528159.1 hypothetical protein [Caulobacter endophyticus]
MSRAVLLGTAAALVTATAAKAQLLTIALAPMSAAPAEQQAAAVLKGGAICIKQGLLSASEMRRAVTSNDSDARLRETLSGAGVMINGSGTAPVEVSGVARITLADACLPDFGFGKIDKISGKAEVAVEWTLTDRATGAEIGRLSTRETAVRNGGTGGLTGLVDEAFMANARALAANPAFRAAAARPLLASARHEAIQPGDPAVLVLAPWRRVTDKTPLSIAPPRIIGSDLDMLYGGAREHFAVALEAGETLRLDMQDAAAKIVMLVNGPGDKYLASTDHKTPERRLTATAKTTGTHIVTLWAPGGQPITAYRLRIDTDRRPYDGSPSRPQIAPANPTSASAPATGPIGPVALRWVVAAPLEAQAAGRIGAADFCTGKEPAHPSEMRHAIESGALDARLRDDLKAAGFQVVGSMTKTPHGVAPVSLAAEVRITNFQGCILNWGLANFDNVFGKAAMSVDWVAHDRATGAELARLTTQQGVDRKKDSGGLLYLTQDAFSANIKALLADPMMKAALRRPALATAKPDDGPARDPLRTIVPPWTPTAFGGFVRLDLPKIAESDIDATDEDQTSARETYKIKVSAGETVLISVTDAQRPLRVGVLDGQKTLLTDTFGAAPSLKWTAPGAGEYLIQVTSADKPRQTSYRMLVESDLRPVDSPKPTLAEAPRPSPEKPPATAPEAPAPKPQSPPPLPPPPKFTPPPGVLLAEVGKSVQRPAGKVGAAVDLFAFIGESGSVLQVTAGAPGAGGHAITLYTPEGDEILKADGVDMTRLNAILPRDGIYMLAVGRQDAAKPYKLTLEAEAPDLFQWSFRNLAGYDVYDAKGGLSFWSCWTAPGSTLRYSFTNGMKGSLTVQRGGDGRWEFDGQGVKPFFTRLAAGVYVRTYEGGGAPDIWNLDAPEPKTGAYRGYFCQ